MCVTVLTTSVASSAVCACRRPGMRPGMRARPIQALPVAPIRDRRSWGILGRYRACLAATTATAATSTTALTTSTTPPPQTHPPASEGEFPSRRFFVVSRVSSVWPYLAMSECESVLVHSLIHSHAS